MNKQNTLTIVLIVILAAIGYLWLSSSESTDKTKQQASNEFEAQLLELSKLKNIKLDTTIFQDPFFRSLNLSAAVPAPEGPVGRKNPFLQIESLTVTNPAPKR